MPACVCVCVHILSLLLPDCNFYSLNCLPLWGWKLISAALGLSSELQFQREMALLFPKFQLGRSQGGALTALAGVMCPGSGKGRQTALIQIKIGWGQHPQRKGNAFLRKGRRVSGRKKTMDSTLRNTTSCSTVHAVPQWQLQLPF